MIVDVQVTRYGVVDGELVEGHSTEPFVLDIKPNGVGESYLVFAGGPQGMPIKGLEEMIELGGWTAQVGTPPVYVEPCKHPQDAPMCCGATCQVPNGGWGGRNYPEYKISASELARVKKELLTA